jgi:hypothetical protein
MYFFEIVPSATYGEPGLLHLHLAWDGSPPDLGNDAAAETLTAELSGARDGAVHGPAGTLLRRLGESLDAARAELATAQRAADEADSLFNESLLTGEVNTAAEKAGAEARSDIERLTRRIERLTAELDAKRAELERLAADAVNRRLRDLTQSTAGEYYNLAAQLHKLLDPVKSRAIFVAALHRLLSGTSPNDHGRRRDITARASRVRADASA